MRCRNAASAGFSVTLPSSRGRSLRSSSRICLSYHNIRRMGVSLFGIQAVTGTVPIGRGPGGRTGPRCLARSSSPLKMIFSEGIAKHGHLTVMCCLKDSASYMDVLSAGHCHNFHVPFSLSRLIPSASTSSIEGSKSSSAGSRASPSGASATARWRG